MQGIILSLIVVSLLSGCAAAYSSAPLPANHPASPATAEAPPPPPSQAFGRDGIPLPPAEEAPAQKSHSGHGAMHGGH